MATASPSSLANRFDVQLLSIAVLVQLVLLVVYLVLVPQLPETPRYILYPLVWITVSLWVAVAVDVPEAPRRRKIGASLFALGYFVVLCYLAGLVGLFPDDRTVAALSGFTIEGGSPGWERLHYVSEMFHVSFVTYRVFGYVVLAYLVYVTLLDASKSFLSGALGLVSCVGCTFPILASLSAGLFGGAVASSVFDFSFDLGTLFFLTAIALLYYRPGFDAGTA